eukprot:CAMPEP_0202815056 /NCGR_PEP_ID=MMETSP1389-20130828/5998_1 /ASSEMBLY_ACC=CAM_ASM_000865 /TAXON_ID=302021 /ORGANISM="Rhodomonas sp., Strain CCMP768" /LENGTH=486 /DNA_ID=CAMNT_0049486931 /DNA_START=253 /DNA_END=1713 /DNA_ORIENTATION=-
MIFDQLAGRIDGAMQKLAGKKKITSNNIETALKDVRRSLLEADVNLNVATNLINDIRERAVGMEVTEGVSPAQQFVKIMQEELTDILGGNVAPLARNEDGITTILMTGLQGTGKTTATAKLALYCKQEEKPRKVLLVACDVYRPAAIDQLETLAKQTNTTVFSRGTDANPIQIAKEAIKFAQDNDFDTVIVDTAGRQVIDAPLMNELKSIKNVVGPDEVLLVVDAMTGQEAANLTKEFNQAVGITGAILTKLDGDTRGGAALSVQAISGKPIKFVGVGEKVEALEPFYPERMASRILGMGDVVSMVEKAQKVVDEKEAARLASKMVEDKYDFEDFLSQSRQIKQMGSMAGMLKMMPGAGGISDKQLAAAEERLKVAESMICSMTRKERADPGLLLSDISAKSRLTRISKGSGRTLRQAQEFMDDFQRMRMMMRNMGKMALNNGPGGPGTAPAANQDPNMAFGNRASRRQGKKGKKNARPAAKGFGR